MLIPLPPEKPTSSPFFPMTLWQGMMIGIGFFPLAPPIALTALILQVLSACS